MKRSWLLLALGLTACKTEPKAQACVVHSDCSTTEACVDEFCKAVECYTSNECNRGTYCSTSYQCVSGCETSLDCPTGEACEAGECAPLTCRDPQLDCDYGEVCDDGSCADEGAGACDRCDPGVDDYCFPLYEGRSCNDDSPCPSGERCYIADYDRSFVCSDSSDCAAGYSCETVNFSDGSTAGPHCVREACFAGAIYPACDPTVPNTCARGFQCFDIGNDIGVCFGDCEWLTENGHL